ncbi:MAG TPA: crossover junction endodeoxyribonuclease RuvC [Candidatus Limnocylindrales bacterium]|nr:crossover junction endodeoxyribonuclease RuvC [Candidatus Limnocylindrales bacterium]
MIVLGIDPGTAALGYGIVERTSSRLRLVDAGCLQTPATWGLPQRLLVIYRHVVDEIELHRPDILAVERLFFSKNAQTAFAVGQARGVVLLAAAQAEVPVREATPNEVKTAVTGYGAADKDQVGRMVATLLDLEAPPRPDDAADAVAIAIWAANSEREGPASMAASGHPVGALDRSAVMPPATTTESPFERAVREALERERGERRRAARRS